MIPISKRELAAYTDAFRAAPELCEVAEIGGATCAALRRRPTGRSTASSAWRSTEPLDEIAAFYGDTPWWVSDSHGLGPELEERGFVRDYGWMKFTRGRRGRGGAQRPRRRAVGPDRAGDFARSSPAASGCPTGPCRSPRTWSAAPAGRATSPTTATRRPARARSSSTKGRLARVRRDTARVPRPWRAERAPRGADRGRAHQGCSTVATETGELEDDRPSNSYRNIVRAGFREAGVRANYQAP